MMEVDFRKEGSDKREATLRNKTAHKINSAVMEMIVITLIITFLSITIFACIIKNTSVPIVNQEYMYCCNPFDAVKVINVNGNYVQFTQFKYNNVTSLRISSFNSKYTSSKKCLEK